MSDIIHLSNRKALRANRSDYEFISAAVVHLLSRAGDPARLKPQMGNAYELPGSLLRLREAAVTHHLLVNDGDTYRIRPARPGKMANHGPSALIPPLAETLQAISGPACLMRLLDISHDQVILAASDILGGLRENGTQICSGRLVEQMAWSLSIEGRHAARQHLSFIDEAFERELPEVRMANVALTEARRRAAEIGGFDSRKPVISNGFLNITIMRHARRVAEAQRRAIGAIDRQVGELLAKAGPHDRTSASVIMADLVANRTSPLALSEFDFRRLPLSCRQNLERERLVYRPVAGEGILSAYRGQSLYDTDSEDMGSCLSSAAASPENRTRIAAICANITRRNGIVVGATEKEADVFLETLREAGLRHRSIHHERTSHVSARKRF